MKRAAVVMVIALFTVACGSHAIRTTFSKDDVIRAFAKHAIRLKVDESGTGLGAHAIIRYVLSPAGDGAGIRAVYVLRDAEAATRTAHNLPLEVAKQEQAKVFLAGNLVIVADRKASAQLLSRIKAALRTLRGT
jgi:hypothetical protein